MDNCINPLNEPRSRQEELSAVSIQSNALSETTARINLLRNESLHVIDKELVASSGFKAFIQQTKEAEEIASSSIDLIEEDIELLGKRSAPIKDLSNTFIAFQQYTQKVSRLSSGEFVSDQEIEQALAKADDLDLEIDRIRAAKEKLTREVASIKKYIAEKKEQQKIFAAVAKETKAKLASVSQQNLSVIQPITQLTPENSAIVPFSPNFLFIHSPKNAQNDTCFSRPCQISHNRYFLLFLLSACLAKHKKDSVPSLPPQIKEIKDDFLD